MNAVRAPLPAVEAILADEASSMWIRSALESALARDPADAFNDALALAAALEARLRRALDLEEPSNPPPEIVSNERQPERMDRTKRR